MATMSQTNLAKNTAKKPKAPAKSPWVGKGNTPPDPNPNKALAPYQTNAAQRTAAGKVFEPDNIKTGNYMINRFLPSGSLGRVSTGMQMTKDQFGNDVPVTDAGGNPVRIQENQDVLNRYADVMNKGMDAPEYQAEREQMQKGMDSNLNTNMNQLAKAQAQGKVYGAAASAQQNNALTADTNNRNDLEQQLGLQSVALKRQGTNEYAGALAGMQTQENAAQKTNLGQTSAERAGQIGLFTGGVQVGKTEKYTEQGFKVAEDSIAAAKALGAMTTSSSTTSGTDAPADVGGSSSSSTKLPTTSAGASGNRSAQLTPAQAALAKKKAQAGVQQ